MREREKDRGELSTYIKDFKYRLALFIRAVEFYIKFSLPKVFFFQKVPQFVWRVRLI